MFTQIDSGEPAADHSSPSRPRRWGQRFVCILALLLVTATVASCGGVYAIPDSHEPVVFALSMLSSMEGWAVGAENHYHTHGMIAHYQDGRWTLVSLPANTPAFYSVFMLSTSDGWAVGVGGAIYHYHDRRWASVSSPVNDTLYSVFMLSPDDGWAVGSEILHYQQGTWTVAQSPQIHLQSLFMLSAHEGWAVGQSGQILHYTGEQWQLVQPPPVAEAIDLTGVTFASPDEGWAVGRNGIILHYHAGSWSDNSLKANTIDLSAVALVSPAEGWAVGTASTNTGLTGAIFHYTQGQWVQVNSPTHSVWYALAMVSANNGWTGGSQGTLLQYDDGKWC